MYLWFIGFVVFIVAVESFDHVSPDCDMAVKDLYVEGSLSEGNAMRREWLHIAPFVIDKMEDSLKRAEVSTVDKYNRDVNYKYDYDRFNMLGPVLSACKQPFEQYGEGDDEKRVCGLKLLEKMLPHCVIYSIGSNNKWGFEEDIYRKTNCSIETFDCTVARNVQPPSEIRSRTRLHHVCVGGGDEVINGQTFMSWSSINKLVGLKGPPTFLKVNICICMAYISNIHI